MDGPRYINSTEEYVKKLVKAMSKSSIKGRNISMDQLYTPISTAKWLLEKNVTCVDTIMTSRIGLTDFCTPWKRQKTFLISPYAHTQQNQSPIGKRTSWCCQPWDRLAVTHVDGKLKPAIIKLYDFTKEGTYIEDQKISKYSCKLVSNSWLC